MSERMKQLRKMQRDSRPAVSAERIVLATEAYRKYAGEPIFLFRARVLEYVLANKEVVIRPGELLVGTLNELPRAASVFPEYSSGLMWLKEQLPDMPTRPTDPLQITRKDTETILHNLDYWDGKSLEDYMDTHMPQEIKVAEAVGAFKSGGRGLCSSCITPNYERMFSLGFRKHIDKCKQNIVQAYASDMTVQKERQTEYWEATVIVLEASIAYSNRYADEAEKLAKLESSEQRREELHEIARICRKVPEHPPETFHEGLQFQWMMHLINYIEAQSAACSCGRFDQIHHQNYARDLEAGRITPDRARELIGMFMLKVDSLFYIGDNYYVKANAGLPMWQVMSVGGLTRDGRDASNELSYLVLDACEEMKLAQPPIALRINRFTPPELIRKGIQMNQEGMSNPAFFSDKTVHQTILNKGGTEQQANDWCIIGCMEPHPGGGICDGSAVGGYLSAPKCMEIALHNGVDPVTGREVGLKTGDPKEWRSMEDVTEAVKKQIVHFGRLHETAYNATQSAAASRLPCVYMSVQLDGCLEKGKCIQEGGPLLNWVNIFIAGTATVGDSIAAIEHAVFKEKTLTMEQLIHMCDTDFEGEERMRQYLINKAPKFGNDNDHVDKIVADVVEHSCRALQEVRDARGGYFSWGDMSQTHNVALGEFVGATPDGRKAYTAFSDNGSPFMGRDTSGPTAAAKSVSKLNAQHCHGGVLYNIRFDPSSAKGSKGMEMMNGLIVSFCDNGGYHIQTNVVSNETLLKAQADPENYRDLVVRVAGYLAYFTELDRKVQNSIIDRTAH